MDFLSWDEEMGRGWSGWRGGGEGGLYSGLGWGFCTGRVCVAAPNNGVGFGEGCNVVVVFTSEQ